MDSTIGPQRPTFKSRARRNKKFPRKNKFVSPQDVARIARRAIKSQVEVKNTSYLFNSIGGALGAIGSGTMGSVSFGTGAMVGALCQGIATGATYNAKVGNDIHLKNIEMSFALTSADVYNFMRILLVRPKGQFVNANPTVTLFTQSLFSGNAASTSQFDCPTDDENFEIWSDDLIPLQTRVGAASSGSSSEVLTPYVYNKTVQINRRVRYQESLGICDRDFFLVAVSDSSVVAHPGAVSGYVKLRWTDA